MSATSLTKEQKTEITSSLRRYLERELDCELSEMKAGFFLEYIMSEIAPFAYNKGVEDARAHILVATEDMSGTCFQEPLTYWSKQRSVREVRRKPSD